jgi:3-hydroxymyristoyl/3-hydroxydecanoyl-(acyl carrier protein) dehydratase
VTDILSDFLIDDFGADLRVRMENGEALFQIPHFKFFEGHFPGSPTLPAYAIIEISLAIARKLNMLSGIPGKISTAKFLSVIKPGDSIKIILKKTNSLVDFEWLQLQGSEWKKATELSVE